MKSHCKIVSNQAGKPKAYFEVHTSSRMPKDMTRFIAWFNETALCGKHDFQQRVVQSVIEHLYLESIYPFEDGNGKIGQAVVLTLSRTIEANRKQSYKGM